MTASRSAGGRFRGRCIIAIFVLGSALSGCIAPMSATEARDVATTRLARYCNNRCGVTSWSNTQQIKDRWLVDFDSPAHKFTVLVQADGNTKVTTWDK
jgi:hypothetical protein